jgi:hypothetical protein
VIELAPGLWRWTARHPEWEPDPEPESPADWPPDVGCVAYAGPGGVALIDPLVEDWGALDEVVAGRRVAVLTTLGFHSRSSDEAVARYGGSTGVPSWVEALDFPDAGETMFWISEHGTLVPGDRLLGAGSGLRLCPESWLRYLPGEIGLDRLRQLLQPLLDLPVERVLVSHGEPVLAGGRDAIAEALA